MRYALFVLVLAAGCRDGEPDGVSGQAPAGLVSIDIEPRDAKLFIEDQTPARATFKALGTFDDGHTEDVTEHVTFSLADPGLGWFEGGAFTSHVQRGGATTVTASAGSVSAWTGLTVVLRRRVSDASAPAEAATRFSGPVEPARAPEVVYPNDGALVPPNLGRLEVHFLPGAGNDLFELAFESDVADVRVYTACTQPTAGGCIYEPSADVWRWIAESNRGGQPLAIRVRGTDGQAVGESAAVALGVAHEPILGGLYYWTTSDGTGIMRFDFASETQTQAEKFLGTELTGGKCIGCHALSRDGSKLVAEAGGQDDGRLLLVDVAAGQPIVPFGSIGKSTFESWSPSGDRFVGVYGDTGATSYNLLLFDGDTGAQVGEIPGTGTAANPADHPDWSPDGEHIAYVEVGHPNTLQRMGGGAIRMVSRAGPDWSAPVELVPRAPGRNRYYPAFAPDSKLLVFNESVCASGNTGWDCDADTDPTARLFAVEARPGATPVALDRANAPGRMDGGNTALANSFPKWSPFELRRTAGELETRLMWVTFSSQRRFGLRSPPKNADGQTGTLLWMAAVDPDRVAQGLDPSYPAFALPFQDFSTSNHIAQWTTVVVPPIK